MREANGAKMTISLTRPKSKAQRLLRAPITSVRSKALKCLEEISESSMLYNAGRFGYLEYENSFSTNQYSPMKLP